MKVQELFNLLVEHNINCFCGVPDSLLKDFCAYLTDNTDTFHHTITANEGNAIALAAGHYLATGRPALVYMQNSGIGNCVNPLLSLTDNEVYNIPLLMFIGWRGEPGKKDEPQHIKQGKVTDKLLESMGIQYSVLPKDFNDAKLLLDKAFKHMEDTKQPYAFIIPKGIFEQYTLINKQKSVSDFVREEAIEQVIKELSISDIIVSTTGHISREVYETRNRLGHTHKADFLTVGSMGHASSIALGIAIEKPDRNIYCFDGDGAFLMHEGSIVVNASKKLKNFKHIVFNNEAHDSVGSQPTAVSNANIRQIAIDSGYEKAYSVSNSEDLAKILPEFIQEQCTVLLEIKVKCGARSDLGRPKEKPQENKEIFMSNLNQVDFCYNGAIDNFSKILNAEKARKILVFTGKKSFIGIKTIIENELKNFEVEYYNDFSTNPKKEDVDKAITNINYKFDIIVAIGGGSVIDFAKAFRYYLNCNKKLIAIPTTSGTGSESTQFAVLYVNGIKTSIDNKNILPEYAICDSQLTVNNPNYLKACTAMDAYCQAIESYWAVKSTEESRKYAKQAIELCKNNIVQYVNTNDKLASNNMMLASHLAGKAINISRTTAAHALSYKITSEYGIPHGHAVALTINRVFIANLNVNNKTCNDRRGLNYLHSIMSDLKQMISNDINKYFSALFKEINIEMDLNKLNISDIGTIINSVNKDRLSNNPCILDLESLFKETNYK